MGCGSWRHGSAPARAAAALHADELHGRAHLLPHRAGPPQRKAATAVLERVRGDLDVYLPFVWPPPGVAIWMAKRESYADKQCSKASQVSLKRLR